MRNRWEESGRDLDAPATITERELRSLRRRAGASVIAMILALLSTGVVGYAVVAGDGKLDLGALRGLIGSAREPAAVQAASPDSVGGESGMPPDSSSARAAASATPAPSAPDSNATVHAGY
jgi:hypothetical protein